MSGNMAGIIMTASIIGGFKLANKFLRPAVKVTTIAGSVGVGALAISAANLSNRLSRNLEPKKKQFYCFRFRFSSIKRVWFIR